MEKEIMFFGKISKDSLSAMFIAECLSEVSANDDLVVYIHCSGGYVTEGMAIYNLFKNCKANSKTAIIVGACQSMATVVTLAFDKVLISPLANYMIHKVSGLVEGNSDNLREVAMQFEKLDTMLLAAYSKKTGKTIEELKVYFEKDTYLSPEEAVKEGFVDGLFEQNIESLPTNFIDLDFENKLNTLSKVFENAKNESNINVLPLNDDNNMFETTIMRNVLVNTGVMSANEFDAFEALYVKDKIKAEAFLKEKQDSFIAAKTLSTEPVAENSSENLASENWQKEVDTKKKVFAQAFSKADDKGDGKPNLPTNRNNWTYEQWEDNDPQGLAKMLDETPEKVEQLAKAYAETNSPFKKSIW